MPSGGRGTPDPLTARERQIASLIGLGLTNRQIASQLGVSDRTVGAHVQNILNKLSANNRAQIATWSAENRLTSDASARPSALAAATTKPPSSPLIIRRTPPAKAISLFALAAVGVIIGTVALTDHLLNPGSASSAGLAHQRGALAYQAQLDGDGVGFTDRWIIGDPNSSGIHFVKGVVEYSILKPDGKTGNGLTMSPLARYLAEVELSVDPGSESIFWFDFARGDPVNPVSQHLIYIDTKARVMRLAYFVEGHDLEFLGPSVPIEALRTGRHFTISGLVNPPPYKITLDGKTVIDLNHQPSPTRQTPTFAIFGSGKGTVHISAIRVYQLK